jgi:hypothetical protein
MGTRKKWKRSCNHRFQLNGSALRLTWNHNVHPASIFPKLDSMESLRGRVAKWLYLDGRPLSITPLVKDYTMFNDLIDFENSRFQIRISKMAYEAFHDKYGTKFMHLMNGMWTGNDGHNYFGFCVHLYGKCN